VEQYGGEGKIEKGQTLEDVEQVSRVDVV